MVAKVWQVITTRVSYLEVDAQSARWSIEIDGPLLNPAYWEIIDEIPDKLDTRTGSQCLAQTPSVP